MSALDSFAGPRVELARYLTSAGERVIYAVRVGDDLALRARKVRRHA